MVMQMLPFEMGRDDDPVLKEYRRAYRQLN